jgi:hypothetical protein
MLVLPSSPQRPLPLRADFEAILHVARSGASDPRIGLGGAARERRRVHLSRHS